MARFVETDLSTRVARICSGMNEVVTIAANEPSLGLFRLQEHVINTVPKQVSERIEIDEISQRLNGINFDMDYDTEAVKAMAEVTHFGNIASDLQKAIELKQKLNRIEARKRHNQQSAAASPSMATDSQRQPTYSINTSTQPTIVSSHTLIKPRQF